MSETFGRRPWISKDQIDSNGVRAEVLIQSGVGIVSSLVESKTGKAYNVHFSVDNNEHGYKGNISKEEAAAKELEKAYENQTPIGFRIEKRRKDHVDRSLPMSEVSPPYDMKAARDNTFKSLVAVLPEGADEWIKTKYMKTRFEEDPVDVQSGGAYDVDLDTFTGGSSNGASATPPVYKGKSPEAPPFTDYNNDGTVNLGSVSVGVPLNIFFFVADYCKSNEVELSEESQKDVASMILKIANTLQRKIYKIREDKDLKRPILSAGSHTRARQLAFELIKLRHPITEELKTDEAFKAWGKEIINDGISLWEWSLSESEKMLSK